MNDRITDSEIEAVRQAATPGDKTMWITPSVVLRMLAEIEASRELEAEIDRVMPKDADEIAAAFAEAQAQCERYGTTLPTSQERNDLRAEVERLTAERDSARISAAEGHEANAQLRAEVTRLRDGIIDAMGYGHGDDIVEALRPLLTPAGAQSREVSNDPD